MARLLVVDSISWRPHLETAMEIALVARERGARVRYLNLRECLPAVEDGSRLPRRLDRNGLRIRRAKRMLAARGVELVEPSASPADVARVRLAARRMLEGVDDTVALRALRHDGFDDIGWGVLSSVIEVTRNPFASLAGFRPLFEDYLATSLLVYELAARAIAEFAPEAVVLFNGRYASTRPILAAARGAGARVVIHERGCDRNHYWLASEPIHDPDYRQRCICEFWRPELEQAGHEFFRERRERVARAWKSYTKTQTRGRLPAAMQQAGRWAVFFTSSEDEFVSISDKYQNKAFPSQLDAIRAVAQAARDAGYRVCVRVHPNVASKSPEQLEFWRRLELPGAVIVGPQDECDSYAILDRSAVVCSYGSTVGIEAAYWGKPSLLTGRAIYDRLGATFSAESIDDIRQFLAAPVVMPQLGALMFGAYFGRYGIPYRHYKPEDLFVGRIAGIYLDPLPLRLWREPARTLRA